MCIRFHIGNPEPLRDHGAQDMTIQIPNQRHFRDEGGDDDVYYYIRWRLKLEGETENMGER